MRLKSRRTLVAAAVVGALGIVAGGAAAFAGSDSGSPRPAARGVSFFARAVSGPVGTTDDCGPGPEKLLPDPIEATAAYLGLSTDQLEHELEAGKSLADVATAHGKSVEGLKQALLDAAKTSTDQAVADGDLTADEAQSLLAKLRAGIDDFVEGKGGPNIRVEVRKGGPGPDIGVVGGPFETAADYVGVSADELMQELRAGKSLAEVASAHGKSVSGLKQALIQAMTADIEKAVDKLVDAKGLPGPPCAVKIAAFGGAGAPDLRVAVGP